MGDELERFLKSLYVDDEDDDMDDEITVLAEPVAIPFWIMWACCVYSYGGYS